MEHPRIGSMEDNQNSLIDAFTTLFRLTIQSILVRKRMNGNLHVTSRRDCVGTPKVSTYDISQ
jgi:hypothetical protein